MGFNRQVNIEAVIRSTFRRFLQIKLSTTKQKAIVLPDFDIPHAATVDLVLSVKRGLSISITQRLDSVISYKHTVGLIAGIVAHFQNLSESDMRERLKKLEAGEEYRALNESPLETLKLSRRMLEDRAAGNVSFALATNYPDIPEQTNELANHFFPVARVLQAWLSCDVGGRSLCKGIDIYSVDTSLSPANIVPIPFV